jgi:hypothetical protein
MNTGRSDALKQAQDYAYARGLCGDVGPFRHLCTRWAGHDGRHQGVRVEETDERIYASWGD